MSDTETKNNVEKKINYGPIGLTFYILQVLVIIIYIFPIAGKFSFVKYLIYFLAIVISIVILFKGNIEYEGSIILTATMLIIVFVIGLFYSEDFRESVLKNLPTPKQIVT